MTSTKPGTGEARVVQCLMRCSGEGLTLAQLSERLFRSPSSVRKSLNKLHTLGVVERTTGQSKQDVTWKLKLPDVAGQLAQQIISVQPMPSNLFNELADALGDGGIVMHCDSFTGKRS